MADYSLFTETPQLAPNADSAVTCGTEFWVNAGCWITGIRYLAPATGDVSARTGAIYDVATQAMVAGPLAIPAGVNGQWVESVFPAPVELPVGHYRVGVHFPNGDYPYTSAYFGGGYVDRVIGPVTLPSQFSVTDLKQGTYSYGDSVAFPNSAASGGGNFWAGVTFTDTDPDATPPTEVTVALEGGGTLAASATPALIAAAPLSGSGTLVVELGSQPVTAPLSGSGSLGGVIVPHASSEVAYGAQGALGGALSPGMSASVDLSGAGLLVGSYWAPPVEIDVDLSGSGQLATTLTPRLKLSSTLAGLGQLGGTSVAVRTVGGQLAGSGQLTAVTSDAPRSVVAALSGSGTLSGPLSGGSEPRDIEVRATLPHSTRRATLFTQTWKDAP